MGRFRKPVLVGGFVRSSFQDDSLLYNQPSSPSMSHWLLFAFDGAGRSNLIMCPPVLNLLPHRPLETPTTSRHVVNSPRRIRVARRPSVLIQALYETFKTLKHFS